MTKKIVILFVYCLLQGCSPIDPALSPQEMILKLETSKKLGLETEIWRNFSGTIRAITCRPPRL